MFNINKEIEPYLVQLKFNENNGSGVIVKPFKESEYLYIFTAKHTFKMMDEHDFETYNSPMKNLDKFEINTNPYSQCKLHAVLDFQELDLIILIIQNNNYSFWKNIPIIKIFNDSLDTSVGYVISGFPSVRNYKSLIFYESKFLLQENSYLKFESKEPLSTYDSNEVDTNGGISGGGVFIEGHNQELYLVGIEVSFEPIRNLLCVDLTKKIDDINTKLTDKIEVGGYPLFDKYNLSDKQFDLELLEEKLDNKYIEEIKDKALSIIRDEELEVNIKLEEEYSETVKKMKDLARSYLYRGVVLNGRDNFASTINIKRAIKLDDTLELYLAQAQYLRNSENYRKIDNIRERDNQVSIDVLKAQIEETSDIESLRKLYIDIVYHLEKYENKHIEEIVNYKEKQIELYLQQLLFKDAENILENRESNKHLKKEYINNRLMDIYFHDLYVKRTELSKKEFANKLIDLLGRLEFNSRDYLEIREKLKALNSFDDYIFSLGEKLIKSERSFKIYEKKITNLTEQVKFVSKHVSDKELLNNINFKLFGSNKKFDEINKSQDINMTKTVNSIKKNNYEHNKDNRSLHFGAYFILISLLIIFNNNEIIKGISLVLDYIKEVWNLF